jgi:hypothetical protein
VQEVREAEHKPEKSWLPGEEEGLAVAKAWLEMQTEAMEPGGGGTLCPTGGQKGQARHLSLFDHWLQVAWAGPALFPTPSRRGSNLP